MALDVDGTSVTVGDPVSAMIRVRPPNPPRAKSQVRSP
jgi:hypothetical protein